MSNRRAVIVEFDDIPNATDGTETSGTVISPGWHETVNAWTCLSTLIMHELPGLPRLAAARIALAIEAIHDASVARTTSKSDC